MKWFEKKKKSLFVLWDTTINLSSGVNEILLSEQLYFEQASMKDNIIHKPFSNNYQHHDIGMQTPEMEATLYILREQHHRLIWKHTHSTESKRTKTTSQVKCQLKLEYWEVDEIGMCIHIYFHYKRINIL